MDLRSVAGEFVSRFARESAAVFLRDSLISSEPFLEDRNMLSGLGESQECGLSGAKTQGSPVCLTAAQVGLLPELSESLRTNLVPGFGMSHL